MIGQRRIEELTAKAEASSEQDLHRSSAGPAEYNNNALYFEGIAPREYGYRSQAQQHKIWDGLGAMTCQLTMKYIVYGNLFEPWVQAE